MISMANNPSPNKISTISHQAAKPTRTGMLIKKTPHSTAIKPKTVVPGIKDSRATHSSKIAINPTCTGQLVKNRPNFSVVLSSYSQLPPLRSGGTDRLVGNDVTDQAEGPTLFGFQGQQAVRRSDLANQFPLVLVFGPKRSTCSGQQRHFRFKSLALQRIKRGQFFWRLHWDAVFELGHKGVVAGNGLCVQNRQITRGFFAIQAFIFQASHTDLLPVVNVFKQPKLQSDRDKSLDQGFVVMVAAGGIHDVGQQWASLWPVRGRISKSPAKGMALDGGGVAKGCSWCTRDARTSHRQNGSALHASSSIQATRSGGVRVGSFNISVMEKVASNAPPGVSMCSTTASQPSANAWSKPATPGLS